MSKRSDNVTVALSALVAVFMIAQQIASKAVRDGVFLTQFDVTRLPEATLAASFVSFAAAIGLGKFIATFTPRAAVPVLFGLNGLLFVFEALLVGQSPEVVAWLLYLHTAAFGGAVVSGFWSVINERFDPYTARRVMGRIAGGATFGGVVGGALTWAFSDAPTSTLLGAFGFGSAVCGVAIAYIGRGLETEATSARSATLFAGVGTLFSSSYPRAIAVVVFLGAAMSGLIDYVFKAEVTGGPSADNLVGFFAVFYTVVGVITFGVQATTTHRVLERFGVVPTVSAFPLTAISLIGVAILSPSLLIFIALRGGAMVMENSLYRSGYELLYTAVPPAQKRSAKVLIDLGLDKLGTAAASTLALAIIATSAADNVERPLLLTALVVGVALIGMLVLVRREYVASLARQLRESLLSDQQQQATDSARSLAGTFVDGADIGLEVVAEHREALDTSTSVEWRDVLQLVKERAAEKTESPELPAVDALARSEIAEDLLATPLRDRLRTVSSGDEDWTMLQQSAPGLVGQLGDLLLSARESLEVRLRAAQLLSIVPTPRSAAALTEALQAAELPVRRTAALALIRICSVSPSLRPPRQTLTELAVLELHRPAGPAQKRRWFELQSPFLEDAMGNRLSPSLELVFLLLAINGDTDELRLALRAITSGDVMRRGTGLEYMDNLLSGDLRHRILALAQNHDLTRDGRRVSREVMTELADRLRAGEIGVKQLRTEVRKARAQRWTDQAADR